MGQWLLWLAPVSGAHLVLLSIRWSEKSAALPVLSSNSPPMLTYCVTLMGCHPQGRTVRHDRSDDTEAAAGPQ